jgi:putative membrane protein
LVLVGIAALIHVWIFVLESLRWTDPKTRRIFGIRKPEDAETLKQMAFNQGFYNLFLALMVTVGIILMAFGESVVGATLVFAGAGAMLLAALVLVASSPRMLKAALVQGVAPLVGVVLLAVGLAS